MAEFCSMCGYCDIDILKMFDELPLPPKGQISYSNVGICEHCGIVAVAKDVKGNCKLGYADFSKGGYKVVWKNGNKKIGWLRHPATRPKRKMSKEKKEWHRKVRKILKDVAKQRKGKQPLIPPEENEILPPVDYFLKFREKYPIK